MNAVVKIEDQEGVKNTLQARIKELEGQVQYERERNALTLPDEVREAVKRLRLHGVILLHVGAQDIPSLANELAPNPILRDVIDLVWPLSTAPVSPDVKQALHVAANYGNNRWF
jgi:hypothetical protein